MKLSRNALRNLANRYRAVLKKCRLLNTFGILLLAALAAWYLAKESAATAWEERREGGTDIGI